MGKVLMIGIDAMDSILLSKFEAQLPNLKKLKQESPGLKLTSVCPPDTPTAWATIYTGLNPAKHGIILFVDPLERVSAMSQDLDNTPVKGKSFWDIAGRFEKKVCLLFPELGCPVWEVNGIMVAKSNQRYGKVAPVQTYPPFLAQECNLWPLSKIKTVVKKKYLPDYIRAHKELVRAETEFGLKMWQADKWDLFFIYSSSLDWIGHNLWSYFDETDPDYPGDSPFQNSFIEFYQLYDQMVGEFMKVADADTTIIVLSDHGQCRRPSKLLNVNEILRGYGLLTPKIKKTDFRDFYYLAEVAKKKIAAFVNKFGVGTVTMRLLHLYPALRTMFTHPLSIDWEKTVAYVSDLSGIKAYYYGGIIINQEKLGDRNYEEIRDFLLRELGQIKEPNTGEKLVKWVCRREELYSGEYITKYPDIVFQLQEDYGAGWALYDSLLSESHTHSIFPGSHRIDTPVLLISNTKGRRPVKKEATLMDIAPTVLALLDIDSHLDLDGESILVHN